MEIEILAEEANPMLHRTDVRFEVVHNEATPGRLSVRDSLAARLNKDAEEVVVHKLDTKYGMRRTVGYAKVYDTPTDAQDVEQEYMLARNKIGDAAEAVETEPDTDDESEPQADEADEEESADEAADEADEEESADEAADEADEEEAAETDDETGGEESTADAEAADEETEEQADEPETEDAEA